MHVLQLVTNEKASFFQEQLAALEDQGVTSVVRSPGGTPSPGESRSIARYVRLTARALQDSRDEYDLIHANYGLTAPAALLQRRLPVVLSLWGSDLYGRFAPVSRFCSARSDEVIVMTDDMANKLGSPCHVIPHGVDTEMFRPLPTDEARAVTGWHANGRHVLFPYDPGRQVKDFPKAARVVSEVRQRLDEPVLLHTLSDVPHDKMVYYHNSADALLLTSKWEGSPNVIKEALACNVPIVSTDVGDVATHLDGVTPSAACETEAQLVDALEATLRVGGPSNGREAIDELTTQRMGERIRAVYERALGRTESTRRVRLRTPSR